MKTAQNFSFNDIFLKQYCSKIKNKKLIQSDQWFKFIWQQHKLA